MERYFYTFIKTFSKFCYLLHVIMSNNDHDSCHLTLYCLNSASVGFWDRLLSNTDSQAHAALKEIFNGVNYGSFLS